MRKIILLTSVLFLVVIFLFSGAYQPNHDGNSELTVTQLSATSHVSQHVQIYSTCQAGNQYLFVPLNSSGVSVFPIWQIYLYGNGNFELYVNNSVAEGGTVVNSIHTTFDWPNVNITKARLYFEGVNYTFDDLISGQLNDQVIQAVSVTSILKGQNQILAGESNVSGDLMYPTWTVTFHSTQRLNYSIYLKGKEIQSGYVLGNKNVTFNVTGSTVTVQVILGSKTYSYPNELISSVPIQKYYGPKPPAAVYTYSEYEIGIAKGFVAAIFGVAVAMFSARKYVLEKEKREAFYI